MYFENDIDLYRVIGANIKYYREQANLTQVQLAEQAKISTSYLSKIEAAGCNKSLSISVLNLKKNEKYLRVSARSSIINHIRIYPILNEDFNNVNTWSVICILFILIIILRRVALPILLVMTIEFAIFINLSYGNYEIFNILKIFCTNFL